MPTIINIRSTEYIYRVEWELEHTNFLFKKHLEYFSFHPSWELQGLNIPLALQPWWVGFDAEQVNISKSVM